MIHLMLNVASIVQHHPTSSSGQTHIYWAKFNAMTRSKDPNVNHEGWALGYDFDADALLLHTQNTSSIDTIVDDLCC